MMCRNCFTHLGLAAAYASRLAELRNTVGDVIQMMKVQSAPTSN
jgi:hypothetical protein